MRSPPRTTLGAGVRVDLDAGAYVVYANAIFKNDSTAAHILNCGVGTPGAQDNFAFAVDVARVEIPPAAKQTIGLTGAIDLDAADNVSFDCYPEGSTEGTINFEDADIGAIQIGALH